MPNTNTITLEIGIGKHEFIWSNHKSNPPVKTQAVVQVPPKPSAPPAKPVDHYNVFAGILIIFAIIFAIVWGLRRVTRKIDIVATAVFVGLIWWIFGRK